MLGDLAGQTVRKPLVIGWSNDAEQAPVRLRRSIESAISQEASTSPGEHHALAQFARMAFPFTPGEQGPLLAGGLPAALLSVSGERGPGAATAISQRRLQTFGRAALRAISALGTAPQTAGLPEPVVVVQRKLLPVWAVQLVVGALLLPLLLVAVDGAARVHRRREPLVMWLRWVLCGALPFLVAVLFARLLGAVGLLDAALPGPAPPGAVTVDVAAAAAVGGAALVFVVGWLALRPLALRLAGVRGDPARRRGHRPAARLRRARRLALAGEPVCRRARRPGAAPLAGGVSPDLRLARGLLVALLVAGLPPFAAVALYDVTELGYGPLAAASSPCWSSPAAPRAPPSSIGWALMVGTLASLVAVIRRRLPPTPRSEPTVLGPAGHAGPGSLGGTESALSR